MSHRARPESPFLQVEKSTKPAQEEHRAGSVGNAQEPGLGKAQRSPASTDGTPWMEPGLGKAQGSLASADVSPKDEGGRAARRCPISSHCTAICPNSFPFYLDWFRKYPIWQSLISLSVIIMKSLRTNNGTESKASSEFLPLAFWFFPEKGNPSCSSPRPFIAGRLRDQHRSPLSHLQRREHRSQSRTNLNFETHFEFELGCGKVTQSL